MRHNNINFIGLIGASTTAIKENQGKRVLSSNQSCLELFVNHFNSSYNRCLMLSLESRDLHSKYPFHPLESSFPIHQSISILIVVWLKGFLFSGHRESICHMNQQAIQ